MAPLGLTHFLFRGHRRASPIRYRWCYSRGNTPAPGTSGLKWLSVLWWGRWFLKQGLKSANPRAAPLVSLAVMSQREILFKDLEIVREREFLTEINGVYHMILVHPRTAFRFFLWVCDAGEVDYPFTLRCYVCQSIKINPWAHTGNLQINQSKISFPGQWSNHLQNYLNWRGLELNADDDDEEEDDLYLISQLSIQCWQEKATTTWWHTAVDFPGCLYQQKLHNRQ